MQSRSLTQMVAQVTEVALRRPWRFFFAAAVLTAVSVWLALGLEISSSFEELLPPNLPSVVHIKELLRRGGGEGTSLATLAKLNSPAHLPGAAAYATQLAGGARGRRASGDPFLQYYPAPAGQFDSA